MTGSSPSRAVGVRAVVAVAAALASVIPAAAISGAAVAQTPVSAPGQPTRVLPPPPPGAMGLTLENAKPLPVPPRPALGTPPAPKAPPRLVLPEVVEAPPPPQITAEAPIPPPPPPAAIPNVPQSLRNQPGPPPAPPDPQVATAPPPRPQPPRSTAPAALPPPPASSAPLPEGPLTITFAAGESELPASVDALLAPVAERLRTRETARLQLFSHASGTEETAREARQLSLARALALRERLTAYGIRSTRIDIRALGASAPGKDGPQDRIDLEFVND